MKRFITSVLLMVFILTCFTSCRDNLRTEEYEVIAINTYDVVIKMEEDGPVKESRLAFIYVADGSARLNDSFGADRREHILRGDTNKYVIVHGAKQTVSFYLYLDEVTYNKFFPKETPAETMP